MGRVDRPVDYMSGVGWTGRAVVVSLSEVVRVASGRLARVVSVVAATTAGLVVAPAGISTKVGGRRRACVYTTHKVATTVEAHE